MGPLFPRVGYSPLVPYNPAPAPSAPDFCTRKALANQGLRSEQKLDAVRNWDEWLFAIRAQEDNGTRSQVRVARGATSDHHDPPRRGTRGGEEWRIFSSAIRRATNPGRFGSARNYRRSAMWLTSTNGKFLAAAILRLQANGSRVRRPDGERPSLTTGHQLSRRGSMMGDPETAALAPS